MNPLEQILLAIVMKDPASYPRDDKYRTCTRIAPFPLRPLSTTRLYARTTPRASQWWSETIIKEPMARSDIKRGFPCFNRSVISGCS